MGIVTFISHLFEIENAVQAAKARALEIMGGKAETYAKQLAPVDSVGFERNKNHEENVEVLYGSSIP